MRAASIADRAQEEAQADPSSQPAVHIRGASALTQAAAPRNGAGRRPVVAAKSGVSPRDRKNRKKAGRLVERAAEAMNSRRYKMAEELYDEAIALLDAPPAGLWMRRLTAASKASNHAYVVDNYQRIRALASSDDELATVDQSYIDCLLAAEFFDEALRVADLWAVRKTRLWAAIRSVAGVIHARLGDFDKAIAIQKSILEKEPGHAVARWHLALHQLQSGDLPAAFETYEARWEMPEFPSERRTFDFPRWNGEAIEGKRILVWREQGIGDEIRFAGVLPDLIAAGAQITFECSAKLAGLFRMSFPEIEVRAARPPAERQPEHYLDFDFEVPVGSLARFFRPTAAQMRARCAPWLKRDAKIEAFVRTTMKAAPQQPIIGLCWRSSNQNLHRNQSYLRPEHLAALRLLGRSGFICLQYDECRDEVGLMQELGLPITLFPSVDQMNNLVAASHLAGACDLVISAGTAVAERSAGLGVPTIIFGRNHSQIQLGTDGVPWHPATRYLPLDPQDPMAIVKSVLFNWGDIAAWAQTASISGRQIDWRLSFPAT
jgi:tetratricopeptide (TPR) repeat protein